MKMTLHANKTFIIQDKNIKYSSRA